MFKQPRLGERFIWVEVLEDRKMDEVEGSDGRVGRSQMLMKGSKGGNFVTKAPQRPNFILNDPVVDSTCEPLAANLYAAFSNAALSFFPTNCPHRLVDYVSPAPHLV